MPARSAADKQRNFLTMFSTMLGAMATARILPDRAERARALANARDFLFASF